MKSGSPPSPGLCGGRELTPPISSSGPRGSSSSLSGLSASAAGRTPDPGVSHSPSETKLSWLQQNYDFYGYSRVKLWTNDTWTPKKLQESVLWYFLALTYLENNISKVDTNRRTRKFLKVTLKLFNIQQLKSFIVQLPSISFP